MRATTYFHLPLLGLYFLEYDSANTPALDWWKTEDGSTVRQVGKLRIIHHTGRTPNHGQPRRQDSEVDNTQ
jgi:hypothetical protein